MTPATIIPADPDGLRENRRDLTFAIHDLPTDPFDVVVQRLRDARCVVRHRSRDSVRAQCPAHRDARPSLVVTRRDDRVLMKCFAGCQQRDVVQALGLRFADLFSSRREPMGAPVVVAEYDYCDLNGEILARKIRTDRKTFRWQTPLAGGWRSGLHGQAVGLYRQPDLVEVRQVLKVEGEKAAERLWSLGLPATCGPSGASQWLDSWTQALWDLGCTEVVILPDADTPGRKHARVVAESCYSRVRRLERDDREQGGPWDAWPTASLTDPEVAPLKVKLIDLPDLHPGGDVYDFLDRHSADDLRHLIEQAPYWYPGLDDEQRQARRREQTRRRVKKKRERDRADRICNAANVSAHELVVPIKGCNAANVRKGVTRNAVTHCERTSVHVTESVTRYRKAA